MVEVPIGGTKTIYEPLQSKTPFLIDPRIKKVLSNPSGGNPFFPHLDDSRFEGHLSLIVQDAKTGTGRMLDVPIELDPIGIAGKPSSATISVSLTPPDPPEYDRTGQYLEASPSRIRVSIECRGRFCQAMGYDAPISSDGVVLVSYLPLVDEDKVREINQKRAQRARALSKERAAKATADRRRRQLEERWPSLTEDSKESARWHAKLEPSVVREGFIVGIVTGRDPATGDLAQRRWCADVYSGTMRCSCGNGQQQFFVRDETSEGCANCVFRFFACK